MDYGQATMLGFGLALIGGGAFALTRPVSSERAVYARRIAGTMLLALGLALCAFALTMALSVQG